MYYLEDDEQLLRGESVRRCVRIENHIMDDQIILHSATLLIMVTEPRYRRKTTGSYRITKFSTLLQYLIFLLPKKCLYLIIIYITYG